MLTQDILFGMNIMTLGGLRRDGPQPHPTPNGSGWPAFERRADVCWDRAGVHWAIRRQLVV